MSDNVRQLALGAFPRRLAAAGILRPSMLRRSVSHLDSHETVGGPSAIASGFPNPHCVIDALLGPLRLTSPLPSFTLPDVAPVGRLPHGRVVELSNRGSTYVVDSGPSAGGPTFVLLHSLACTGLLTWYSSLEMMRRFGRVVVFDQRCHGSGIDLIEKPTGMNVSMPSSSANAATSSAQSSSWKRGEAIPEPWQR